MGNSRDLPAAAMDALLLTIYFLVVFYVLYQMALSLEDKLEDKVIIHLDKDFLAEQTQAQLSCQASAKHITASVEEVGLKKSKIKFTVLSLSLGKKISEAEMNSPEIQDLKKMGLDAAAITSMLQTRMTLRVSPVGQQPLRPISFLSITATNDTPDMQLYINWDRSSLEMSKQGHRIIRSTPNRPLDLSRPQIFSLVNPGQSVTSDITIETNYFLNPETGQITLGQPLVDLKQRLEFSKMTDPTTDDKNVQPLYGLDLMVRLKRTTDSDDKIIKLLIPFSFTLEIKPDQIALPPLRWLLRHTGRRNRPEGSWFWGRRRLM